MSGALVPLPCAVCGAKKVQAHHHDYSRPLDVEWLCFACHQAAHGKVSAGDRDAAPCFVTPKR